MNDADGALKTEVTRPPGNCQGIFGAAATAAHDGVHSHIEQGMVGQPAQLLIEKLHALLRDLVRCDIVDADQGRVEPGGIQVANQRWCEQVPIGDQRRDGSAAPDVPDDYVMSGCSRGSPPLRVMMLVPREPPTGRSDAAGLRQARSNSLQ